MYFNDKEDTNIDDVFKQEKKSFNFEEYKKPIIIGGIILLLLLIILIIILVAKNRKVYSIILNSGNEISVYRGIEFIDPGYKAFDNHQNDLTNSVVVSGTVDTDTIGEYILKYSLKNKSVERKVNVIVSQSQFTKIYLEGEKEMTIKVGEAYVEPGYYYNDILVGDMTDKIVVNGTVDSTKAGKYRISYTVVNSEDVTITAERVVTVE